MNHSRELRTLIKEARALDRLGFAVPEAAVHAALQAGRLALMEESLNDTLEEYYAVWPLSSVTSGQSSLSPTNTCLLFGSLQNPRR